MISVFILCMVVAAFCAPQLPTPVRRLPFNSILEPRLDPRLLPRVKPPFRHPTILHDVREDFGDGRFSYSFETENGINMGAIGRPGAKGQSNIEGFYRFPLPEGGFAEVRYIADEFGFRAESPIIPTPPPLPPHAIEQIRIAEEQRARGIRFE